MKYLSMLLTMLAVCVCFSGCDSDDEETTDFASVIAGDYSGRIVRMGYTNQYAAYVTLTRRADSAVSIVVDCDELNMHMSSVILDITATGSSYELSSTTKAASGSVVGKNLNYTFSSGSYTYTFYGEK